MEKPKRGKKKVSEATDDNVAENIQIVLEDPQQAKKRGRKPKGGKLTSKQVDQEQKPEPVANIILHLKCSLSDLDDYNTQMTKMITDPLEYNPSAPPTVLTYNDEQMSLLSYKNETVFSDVQKNAYVPQPTETYVCTKCSTLPETTEDDDSSIQIKDVNSKLKKLKINLYKNVNTDKKSACFWCTYDFDNPPCYIPKYEIDGQIYGYGSFCRPECAVAHLMKEHLDDSTKFERYHLLNQIYSKIYDFKKNIKPAPNPYYLLEKFYGTLTIQEYRKLLKTEHMLLVIDKPMTRVLPELHEDTEDFISNIYGVSKSTGPSQQGTYKVKRQSEKQQGPSKNSIMRDKFGMSAQ